MKHLKIYENYFNIENWCESNFSRTLPTPKWKIVDGEINIEGDVWMKHTIKKLPFKFNVVDGHFTCDNNYLTTLENFPNYVRGIFNCDQNKLTTLLGGPKYVGSEYHCESNDLKDFYGFPLRFYSHVYVGNNPVAGLLNVVFHRDKEKDGHNPEGVLVKLILLLNEYKVIRNGDTIIEDRFIEALHGIGMNKIPDIEFKNYKLI